MMVISLDHAWLFRYTSLMETKSHTGENKMNLKRSIEKNRKRAYIKYVKEAKQCALSSGCSFMTYQEWKQWRKEKQVA